MLRHTFFHAALSAAAVCQTVEEGYGARLTPLPNGTSAPLVLSPDETVYFEGRDLVYAGPTRVVLLHFASPVFASFTVRLDAGTLLFGESSTHSVWSVPLPGGGMPRQLATVPFNYSAAAYGNTHALISAQRSGGTENDVVALDLSTGAIDVIAVVPGFSGPVVLDAAGNLYYATAAATADVVRFPAARVRGAFGPGHLTLADAEVVARGLPAAATLALDGDQDLFVGDWATPSVIELSDVDRPQPRRTTLVDMRGTDWSPGALQFVAGRSAHVFEAFQPESGGQLVVHEATLAGASRLRELSPARAAASVQPGTPVPSGPFALLLAGGAKNGVGLLALQIARSPLESPVALPGFEAPLPWADALLQPAAVLPVALDAAGAAGFRAFNPGLAPAVPLVCQFAFLDAAGIKVGSSAPLPLALAR
jgi:hypothetical protein